MNTYIFEYRDENNKPKGLLVEAENGKGALEAARKQMKKGWYLVTTYRRAVNAYGKPLVRPVVD